MLQLKVVCQTYDWGKSGTDSKVATLASAGDASMKVDPKEHYAELWMGTHPKGPSSIAADGKLLSTWLAENPDLAGGKLGGGTNVDLPFLFKVLSVGKALSIQVHPNKDEAVMLHKNDAKNYPDPNHKPEMAIALTPFELLCTFRGASEVLKNIEACEELISLVGSSNVASLRQALGKTEAEREALKMCFSSLMNQSGDQVSTQLRKLLSRVSSATTMGTVQLELINRLNSNYPGDVGCWAPFFMNYFTLQPGEAVFLGPNEPHAYLSGDCIECMACSDNTVRAGLTPKYKDVQNLCRMLTYKSATPDALKLKPRVNANEHLTIYDPPVSEFCVHKIEVPNAGTYTMSPLPNCSIVLVLNGEAEVALQQPAKLSTGFIGLVPARQKITMSVKQSPLIIFRAFAKQ